MKEVFAVIASVILVFSSSAQNPYPADVFRIQASWLETGISILYSSSPSSPVLNKRVANSELPFVPIANLSASGGEYIDTDVIEGVLYEYLTTNGTSRLMQCGGNLPLVEQRGWYVILVDNTLLPGLGLEFKRFRTNLYTDGYRVKVIPIDRTLTPIEVRSILQQTHNELSGGIKQVLLLGHIPVPYSGVIGIDEHDDHDGAWATDTYYADLDGIWLDEATVDYSEREENRNYPGDGKFDHDTMPSAAELELGRVDMYDLPAFGLSESALINRYLAKNNLFKSGNLTIFARGLETRGSFYPFLGFLADLSSAVGINGLFDGAYSTLSTQPKTFSYGYGASNYSICGGVVSTADFAGSNWFSVFTGFAGSYLWDFDFTNSLMRASLFSNGSILTCSFGPQYWELMGTGKSIGEVNKLNHINAREIVSSLHGDPSVRINYPMMPTNLSVSTNEDSTAVTLVWTASNETDEPLLGYHVYRSSSFDSVATRLSSEPINGTSFIDENPLPGKNYYIVKLITQRPTGSGSFINSSIGLIDSVLIPVQAQFNWEVGFNLNETYCLGETVSNIDINVLQGEILSNSVNLTFSDENGDFENPSFALTAQIVDGSVEFVMPDLVQNGNYAIKITDANNQFAEVISESFTYYELPELSLNYSIHYDTLEFNVVGSNEFISGIFISPNSELSIQDSVFVFGEEGEFTFTVQAQNACGTFQLVDTIYSTLNTSIITGFSFEQLQSVVVGKNWTS